MLKHPKEQAPQAREEGLVVQELPDEVLVYDLEHHKAHCLNQTAALVWKRCDGKRTVRQIATSLSGEIKAAVDDTLVWFAVQQLGKARLLRERLPPPPGNGVKLSRRQMVGRVGLAAILAVPVVTTIMVPTAQAAASCLPPGSACQTGIVCCPPASLCSNGVCI